MYPLVLEPEKKKQFYDKKPPMNWKIINTRSPYVWMLGATVIITLMARCIDPEELKAAQEWKKKKYGDKADEKWFWEGRDGRDSHWSHA